MLSPRLHNFLDERHAPYTTLTHDRTITAHETASAAHVGRQLFAKTVMLKVDGTLAMMVMPAAYRVDLTRLSRALGGRLVELAEEAEFKDAFPDCEARGDAAVRQSLRHAGVRRFAPGRAARDRVQRRLAHRCGAHAVQASSSGSRSQNCCGWRT